MVWELMSEDPLTPESLAVSVQSEPPSEGGSADGQPRPHRRRRRRRRRGGRGGGPQGNGGGLGERSEDLAATGPERPVDGRPVRPAEGQRLGRAGLGQSQLPPVPQGPPGSPGPHPARGPRSRSPDRRLRGRRRPAGAPAGRDDRRHGARRFPPAARVHRARFHRPELHPDPRDRSRRDVRARHRPADAHRPRPALPHRGPAEGRQDDPPQDGWPTPSRSTTPTCT